MQVLCLFGMLNMGCDWARIEDTSCPDPIVCYRDLDGDGIGRDVKPIWACEESIPPGYVPINGDMCEDTTALNWDGIQFEGCKFDLTGCVPLEWQGVLYEVANIRGHCYFAQDLRVALTNEGDSIHEVTSTSNFLDNGFFKGTKHPESGYLYGVDLVYPVNLLCPPGWSVWSRYESEWFIKEVQSYTNVSDGLKKNGFWEEATGDYWGFGSIPNGVFDRNLGYVSEGNLAAYYAIYGSTVWDISVLEHDRIDVESFWASYGWPAYPAWGELRSVRCTKW